MIIDKFWKYFWVGTGTAMLAGLVLALSLFTFYTRQGDLLAAIGVTYEEGKDPFATSILGGTGSDAVLLNSGYLYQNGLPLHFTNWTWEALADWRNAEEKQEGNYALKANFKTAGATIGISGPEIDTHEMKSISMYVRVDSSVGDLFFNVYDKTGNTLNQQSLGWYTESGKLTPNKWVRVSVPLINLSSGISPSLITGFSISAQNPGVAFLDAVQLSKTTIFHPVWVAPPDTSGHAFNPFATSSPESFPYHLVPSLEDLARWYTYYGYFGLGKSGEVEVGPSAALKSTGSLTILRGGSNWGDYKAEAVLNWGQVSVFSMLARFAGDGDFVSCAFSRYGEGAQLYHVKNGVSTFISQTPMLAVKDFEPWAGVRVGVEVRGERVACFIGGSKVLRANLPGVAPKGTVGTETWDPNPEAKPHRVVSFEVTPLLSE